jgi:hypothetical protein
MLSKIKGMIMGKKKKEEEPKAAPKKKAPEKKATKKKSAPKKEKKPTAESLIADGYIHLKDKGDVAIYAKNGHRVSIDK